MIDLLTIFVVYRGIVAYIATAGLMTSIVQPSSSVSGSRSGSTITRFIVSSDFDTPTAALAFDFLVILLVVGRSGIRATDSLSESAFG